MNMTRDNWQVFDSNLRQFIKRRVQNEYDAEDILQDVLFKVHCNLSKLEDPDKLLPWIYQIARHGIVDYYRSRKIALPLSDLLENPAGEAFADNFNEEITPCIKPIMEDLPERYRQALSLVYIEGMTQREVAENLGLSISGAKSRVQRGREKLKKKLLDCCRFEFDTTGNILDYQHKEQSCGYCGSKAKEK